MKPPIKRAPKSLPPAVSDLVAEGGNVLASDDAAAPTKEVADARTPTAHAIEQGQAKPPGAKA